MKKFFSRKFIMAFCGVASGISLTLLGQGDFWCKIVGSVLTIVCAVVYMIVEGKIDAKSAGQIRESIQNIKDAVEQSAEDGEDGVDA